MKTGKWLPLLVVALIAGGLDYTALRVGRGPASEDREEGTNALGALHQRLLMMQDARGQIPPDAFLQAKAHAERLRARWLGRHPGAALQAPASTGATPIGASALAPGFRWLGPISAGGRIRAIAIHPANPDTLVVGSAGGGIWRSTDGGASWTACDDFMPALSVSSIVFDPRDPNVLYAGTGEGYGNGDALRGAGVFKSTDGGITWVRLPATAPSATYNFLYTNRLAFSSDGAVLLAATSNGVFRSTDGGASFAATSVAVRILQVVFNPNAPNEAIAAGVGVLYSTHDGGLTWVSAVGLPGGRTEIAYSRADNSVYASVDSGGGQLYRSVDGGASFSRVASQSSGFLGGQGWYSNTIWVNPFDPANIVIGGVNLSESTNGGANVSNVDSYPMHSDDHVVVADPRFDNATNRTVYVGNDGGLFRTTDIRPGINNAVQWQSLNNGLGVTQFYGADGMRATGEIVGGAQDTATHRYLNGSWVNGWIGDTGYVAADQYDSRIFYMDTQYAVPYASTDGGASWLGIGYGITDGQATNFIAPLVIDPNDRHRLYLGKGALWRTDSANGSAAQFFTAKPASGDYISAIAVQPGNSDIVWVGHNSGAVYRTTNGTSTSPAWTQVRNVGNYVTRITLNPDDPNDVFVTRGGFQGDNVWHSTDGGATWTAAAGAGVSALPFAPVFDLEIDPVTPGTLYAATEVGLFKSTDNGASWDVPNGLGPANTRVTETFWMGGTLIVATHGRGIWALDVNPSAGTPGLAASPSSLTFTSPVGRTSAAQSVAIKNSGTGPMNVQSVWIGGDGSSFAIAGDGCTGTNMAPGGSCIIQVTFTPAASARQSGILWIADTAPGSPHGVQLSGTATTAQAPLPSPWAAQDIGTVGAAGGASYANGTFTVSGSGTDVWNTADAFQFVYQPLSGDGTIVAHVATVQPVAGWTKTGVMIRQALTPDAAQAFMIVSAGKGLAFQRRTAQGGISTSTSGIGGAAPMWVRITRAGTTVTASYSPDGATWTTAGQDTIQLSATAYVGLAVSSHDNSQAATATFDQVSVTAAAALPAGWDTADIGQVGAAGSARASNGTFTVAGAGADVWGTADAVRYAYYPLAGDGTIVAHVASVEYVAAWTKAGVMLRQSLSPDSAHAFMLVSAGKGLAFQRRTAAGGLSTNTPGGSSAAPTWVKLVRVGQSVAAYASSDGAAWTLVGQDTIAFAGQVWAGLAVSSHDATRAATATFDNVSITASAALPGGWQHADVGNVGPAGSATASGGTFTVKGAGADVWSTADALHYAYTTLAGDGEIVARVAAVENVAAWTKAGVMIRGSLDPSSPQAFMLVSAGKGLAFQRRLSQGAISASTSAAGGSAPAWVRLVRSGGLISAYWSTDGTAWTFVDQDTLAISGSVYVGLAVSSHDATRVATATFDGVAVR